MTEEFAIFVPDVSNQSVHPTLATIASFLGIPWVYWSLTIAYGVTVLSIVAVVLSENRNPVKSLAWVTVLLTFPIGGLILYIFFGRSIRNTSMISRRKRRKLLQSEPELLHPDLTDEPELSRESRQLIQLSRTLTGGRYYPDNRVELFTDGKSKFERLKKDLRDARDYINIQYYIISDDELGREIAGILTEKVREGVNVRVIYDDIGSLGTKRRFFKEMQQAGVQAYPFFRVAFPPFGSRINWRNHRKVCVIDGKAGYIGGMNIATRYLDGGPKFNDWTDAHIRIEGPAVAALHYSFAVDWNFMGQPLIEERPAATPPEPSAPGMKGGMQMVTSGPTSRWSNVAMVMLKAIGAAKKRVFIQTPYFLPPDSMLHALQDAALAGVDVRVMMPRQSDSLILTYASRSFVSECLRAGIKILMYEGGMLHSKVLLVDDEFSSVGSANIDFRSFEHNFEGNMMVYGTDLNSELRRRFAEAQNRSSRVKATDWRHRPLHHKVLESIVRLLSPVL